MHDMARVRWQARRTYELNRLRIASRVVAVVAPLTILSACETGAVVGTTLLGVSLLIVAIGLRWWHRIGIEATEIGLRTGGAATVVALAVCRLTPSMSPNVAMTLCVAAGFLAGALSGKTIARHATSDWHRLVLTIGVSALTAALGCVALGVGSLLGGSLAVGVAGAAASALRRAGA